jgi:deazaflavin-dependent oxidoreductase (nitroreductase family)
MVPLPRSRLVIWLVSRLNRFWYRLTGGRIGGKVGSMPVLLLTTIGRRSGKSRTAPLCYLEEGDRLVVVASNVGREDDPGWWYNLQINPAATVQIGRTLTPVRAREADAIERQHFWSQFVARHRAYNVYQSRTSRGIPVVVLERMAT